MDKVHFKQGDYVEKLSSCKISTLVFINMKNTLRIIIDAPSYLRYEVLELVNYDHSQSVNGTRCLPVLRITSQQTIILMILTSRSDVLKAVITNNAVI
jgi:hypothetical protein